MLLDVFHLKRAIHVVIVFGDEAATSFLRFKIERVGALALRKQRVVQLIHPAGCAVRKRIAVGYIGFDIQNGCALDEVAPSNMQCVSHDPVEEDR